MNRYPLWKYAIIVIALLVGSIYTLPNFFGEAPAVQVSAAKSSVKVDAAVQERVQAALAAAKITPEVLTLDNGSLKARFDNTDSQLKAKDAIQQALVPDANGLVCRGPQFVGPLTRVVVCVARSAHVFGFGLARWCALHVASRHACGLD